MDKPPNERKRDTREKIILGGLIVKSGLREADRAFILGLLVEGAKIETGSVEYERLRRTGNAAFNEK